MTKRRNHDEISERRVLDRINDLPNDILLRILSFLAETTERARTSVLSRRWRHLWTHFPSIEFHFPTDSDSDADATAHNYVAAVDSCLRLVSAPALDLFAVHLWLPTLSPPSEIQANARVANRWFRFAGDRTVRRLSVMAQTWPGTWSGNCRIPSSIFCCRALTELNVSFSTFPAIPSDFRGFHSLKTLSFSCGTIDNDTVADLLPCCPLLESLSLIRCDNLDYLQVSPKDVPNLKRLILFSETNLSITASIEAPNLEFFNFKGDLQELHWTGSKALREAIIRDNGDDEITPDTKDDWMNLVLAVSGVRVLTINHWFCQLTLPLHHLRMVTLEEFIGSKYEMFLAKFLLRSAVSLEEFIVFDYLGRDEVRTEEELQLLFAPIPKASSCVQMKLTLMDTWKLPRLLK